jgi:16S rRNA processing protein RimM
VVEGREFKGRWVVLLEGITSMNDAETLRGLELRVTPEERKSLKAGAYYVHDLEGCEVVTTNGAAVGRVSSVDLTVGTPVLVVAGPGGEVLVPLAEEICRAVDPASKRIVIDPPEGLIDLNAGRTVASEPRERAMRPERGVGAPARAHERGPGTKSPEE